MTKRLVGLVALAVATGAAAWIVSGVDDAPPATTEAEERVALLASLGYANPACSLCHYAWDATLLVEGEATPDARAMRVEAATGGAHDLVDVRAVPIVRGDESTSAVVLEERVTVLAGRTEDVVVHVSDGATVLFATARLADERSRGALAVAIEAPDGTVVEGTSALPLVFARAADAAGLAEGYYAIRVRLDDGTRPAEEVVVEYDIGGRGVLPLDDLPEGPPASWSFAFDEAPRAVQVTYRPWNAHPTDKWILPSFGDIGRYSTLLHVGPPTNGSRAWTEEEVDAGWGDAARIVLVDESVSGTTVRLRNERGEWTTRSSWRAPPGPEEPFASIPPGATRIEAAIEWEPASPASPMPELYFAYTLPGNPAFFYPEPVERGDGFLRYEVDVDERHWEGFSGTGAFQGFALMRVDEDGKVVFDGTRRLLVEAVR